MNEEVNERPLMTNSGYPNRIDEESLTPVTKEMIRTINDIKVKLTNDKLKKNNYKSRLDYWANTSKPVFAIFFSYFNLIQHKKIHEGINEIDGVEIVGLMNDDNIFISSLSDTPPTYFTNTVFIKIDGNHYSVKMQAYKDGSEVRNELRITSSELTHVDSTDLYKKLFKLALDSSNLKGSYITIPEKQLEWTIRDLSDITFEDVHLPKILMEDLAMYTSLFEKRKILQRYMFSGVPGTGKTESTRAISSILNKQGVTVIKTNICDIIKQKFDLATILAPSIVILDDIDLYLGDRNSTGVSSLLGKFLDIMDGVDKLPDDVGVIASTNAPHLIDLAAQRPGRFNKLLFFDELTKENIISIISKSLKMMNDEFGNIVDDDYILLTNDRLVSFYHSNGCTGAFIYESVRNIKHKQEILGTDLNLDDVVAELKTNDAILTKKLNANLIKGKLGSGNGSGIGFQN